MMNFKTLLRKHRALLAKNKALKEENQSLKARLIAERKTNTLILTHRQQLLSQWMAKLAQFLEIDEELPVVAKTRGRRPRRSLIVLPCYGQV